MGWPTTLMVPTEIETNEAGLTVLMALTTFFVTWMAALLVMVNNLVVSISSIGWKSLTPLAKSIAPVR